MIASLALGGMAMGDGLLGGGKGNGGSGGSGGGSGGSGGGSGPGKGSGGGSGPSKGSGGGSGPGKGSGGSDSGPSKGSGGSGPSKGSGGSDSGSGPSNPGGGRTGSSSGPRIVPSRDDRNQTPLIQNTRTGRSGRNTATTKTNNVRDARSPIIVNSVPSRDTRFGNNGYGSIGQQATREDRAYANYRHGYYQYNNYWQDCNFWYPYYGYTPSQHCIVGPFYWYSNLPAYIFLSRIIWTDDCIRFNDWRDYRYRSNDRNDRYDWYGDDDYRSRNAIDDAIYDLEDAFLSRDYRSLDRLIPRRSQITVNDRSYRNYRVRSEDFYDLMADLVSNTRTRDFYISRVQTRGDYVRIYAQHIYEDAWRQNRNVYMTFILRESRGNYEIVEFETSGNRY